MSEIKQKKRRFNVLIQGAIQLRVKLRGTSCVDDNIDILNQFLTLLWIHA
jgi:hypothetical protein